VELNIRLGGQCRIYREEEGSESELFISYFEEDLEYLFGGTETAFRKVEDITWEPRLYHICRLVDHENPRKENNFYVSVVERNGNVLTHDDVFVLDMGHKIFQFNGHRADVPHRHFGTQFCFQINYYDHRGQAQRIPLEVS
jgi:gelsolin